MSKRLVCLCNMVTEKEITNALKNGARSTPDIQKITCAGTTCGRCLVIIDALVVDFLESLPVDQQQKIIFDDSSNL